MFKQKINTSSHFLEKSTVAFLRSFCTDKSSYCHNLLAGCLGLCSVVWHGMVFYGQRNGNVKFVIKHSVLFASMGWYCFSGLGFVCQLV